MNSLLDSAVAAHGSLEPMESDQVDHLRRLRYRGLLAPQGQG